MKMKVEFKTLLSKKRESLEEKINKHLADGWILDGRVSVDHNTDIYGGEQSFVYYQNLLRRKKG